jgi:inositol-phosphate phosphatase/L-galactose 1-phosphate phosphatase/histidinol-phosphatase
MTAPCPEVFLAFAERLADAGAAVARRYFRTPVGVDDKADQSPVTIADREAEAAIRALIREAYPDHGIVGEEHGAERPGAEHVWVIDPIDGTRSFITGRPTFGTILALLRDGRPILGIIEQPALGERWVGARGRPTTHNGRPVRTRECPDLAHAVLSTTSPHFFEDGPAAAFERVRRACRMTMYGGDCYIYGLLASGFGDLVIEATLKAHDFLPLVCVLEGAGGLITDWRGAPLTLESDDKVVAAGDRRAHAAALALLTAG